MDRLNQLNTNWTDIYYHLRYSHDEKISHQSIRILQVIEKEDEVGIKLIAQCLQVSQNTASEHVKRLIEKEYIYKTRSSVDERRVILKLTALGTEVLHRHSRLDKEKLQLIFDKLTDAEAQSILQAFQLLKQKAVEK
ncbi:MarR family winged helix-turn-helix transcriptional regulator [Alkalihalobacillus trypoxylicola]|uniref:HTH-type transcriptional regulator SarZ n=1 Tax=Alkalihalobacillus trypoxylicola TaxID=519424 RepID=A0A162D4V1_9BACI|nr:MarR family winged helix-turn-helix transcriptional regulator [Alkalihalobacillus trypoxylicola]KYG28109.1 MarR family transcriptional regulator [Alkalihalobacillus trypoxylicola]